MPVSTALANRQFGIMRRAKNNTRSIMSAERMSGLAMLHSAYVTDIRTLTLKILSYSSVAKRTENSTSVRQSDYYEHNRGLYLFDILGLFQKKICLVTAYLLFVILKLLIFSTK